MSSKFVENYLSYTRTERLKIANRIGVSEVTLINWKNKKRAPNYEHWDKVMEEFNMSENDMREHFGACLIGDNSTAFERAFYSFSHTHRRKIAECVGVNLPNLNNWLNRKYKPKGENWNKIKDALKITEDDMIEHFRSSDAKLNNFQVALDSATIKGAKYLAKEMRVTTACVIKWHKAESRPSGERWHKLKSILNLTEDDMLEHFGSRFTGRSSIRRNEGKK